MSSTDNKQLMQDIFSGLSKGNDKPFIEAMAEDTQWTWMGTGQWSRTFKGKNINTQRTMGCGKKYDKPAVHRCCAPFYCRRRLRGSRASGQNTTPEGKTYNNKYCWVCRFAEGKLQELNEYMDTELVTATFS